MRTGCFFAQTVSALKIVLNKKRAINGLDIRTWDKPDEQAGDLCRRFIQKWGGTTIYRDAEYLQWRLFDNPYAKSVVKAIYSQNHLLGWTAFTLGDDGMGYLVDLMAVADDDSEFAIEDIISLLLYEAVIGTRNMGATGIRGWHVNNHPFDRLICHAAKKIGFYHIRRGHAVVLYNCEAQMRVSYNKFDDWFISRIFTEGVLG